MSSTYSFYIGGSVSNDIENIEKMKEDFRHFKEEFGKNKIIYNDIQSLFSLWKYGQ